MIKLLKLSQGREVKVNKTKKQKTIQEKKMYKICDN